MPDENPESAVEPRIVTFLECDLPRFIMTGSLSKKTRYSLRADGPIGERELRNLIALVEAQIVALADDEANHA